MADDKKLSDVFSKMAAEVRLFQEDVKQQAAQAGKELKEAWQGIGPELEKVAGQVEDASKAALDAAQEAVPDEAKLKLHLGLMEVRDRWGKMEPTLDKIAHGVSKAAHETKDALEKLPGEAVKLQAHLAAMDTKDAVEARTRQVKAQLHKAAQSTEAVAAEVVEEMSKSLANLRDRLAGKKK